MLRRRRSIFALQHHCKEKQGSSFFDSRLRMLAMNQKWRIVDTMRTRNQACADRSRLKAGSDFCNAFPP
jgi:hypothetical protein